MCVLSKLYFPRELSKKLITSPKSPIMVTRNHDMIHKKKIGNDINIQCSICYTGISVDNAFTTICNHTFCNPCATRWVLTNDTCPLCRSNISGVSMLNLGVDEDDDFEETSESTIGLRISCSSFDLPERIITSSLMRTFNLVEYLNHENEETFPSNLNTNWNIQRQPPTSGWRFQNEVYTTTMMYKNIKYAIYVEPNTHDSTSPRLLVSSNIRYAWIHIVQISFKDQLMKKKYQARSDFNSKQTNYDLKCNWIHQNTNQRAKRYNHRV